MNVIKMNRLGGMLSNILPEKWRNYVLKSLPQYTQVFEALVRMGHPFGGRIF